MAEEERRRKPPGSGRRGRKVSKAIPEEMAHLRPAQARAFLRMPKRYHDFATGVLKVEDMDLEELQRGQLRDLSGSFSGPPPATLPSSFYRAMADEYVRRVEQSHRVAVNESYEALRNVLKHAGAPADAKVKAANSLLDRLAGPVISKSEQTISVKQPWEELLENASVEVDLGEVEAKQIDNVVDAEVVEES